MSDRPDNYFTMFTGDYLRDTMHLTTRQHGAYQLLLMHYYGTGRPLPLNEIAVRTITRESPDEWKQDGPIVMAFFTDETDGWHQKRADKELQGANTRYTKAVKAANAKHAAKQKPSNSQAGNGADSRASPEHMLGGCEPSPSPSAKGLGSLRNPKPLAPRQPAHDASAAAAAPQGEPGWELGKPLWESYRAKVGEPAWALWFRSLCLNGSETSVIARSSFEATEVGKRYGNDLTVHFHTPVKISYPRLGAKAEDGGQLYVEADYC